MLHHRIYNPKQSRLAAVCGFALTLFFVSAAAAQTIRRVDGDLPTSGIHDGVAWATAYKFLQDALAFAAAHPELNPYEIWVAKAAQPYRPDQDAAHPGGTNDAAATFGLLKHVKVFGGFAGGETQLLQRDYVANETVLSGEIGAPGVADNSDHVVTALDVNQSAVLDGFTICGGHADYGGGIKIDDSGNDPGNIGPIVARCKLTGNDAFAGGAVTLEGTVPNPVFINCAFIANSAYIGGAMNWKGINGAQATLANCLFANNVADLWGGAMSPGPNARIINCTFAGNSALVGGALYVKDATGTVVANSILWGNTPSQIDGESGADVTVNYSDVQGGWTGPGTGNAGGDPRFVNAAAGDYRLSKACSVCVDAGHPDDGGTVNSSCAVPAGYYVPCAQVCATLPPGTGSGLPCDNPWDVDQDGTTGEPTPDLRFHATSNSGPRVLDGEGDAADDARIDMGAYEFVRSCCPWDCQMNYPADSRVGADDLNTLFAQWGQTCTTCDFGAGSDGVSTEDQQALLAHWGYCACEIPEGAAASESELTELSLEEALAILGFDSVGAYLTWGQEATEVEVYASTVLLLELFGY